MSAPRTIRGRPGLHDAADLLRGRGRVGRERGRSRRLLRADPGDRSAVGPRRRPPRRDPGPLRWTGSCPRRGSGGHVGRGSGRASRRAGLPGPLPRVRSRLPVSRRARPVVGHAAARHAPHFGPGREHRDRRRAHRDLQHAQPGRVEPHRPHRRAALRSSGGLDPRRQDHLPSWPAFRCSASRSRPKSPAKSRHTAWTWLASFCVLSYSSTKVGPWTR